jgi:hypothetical protein
MVLWRVTLLPANIATFGLRRFSGTDRHNRISCCSERIVGARILLSTAPDAEDIVWASKFTESLASYTFGRSNRFFFRVTSFAHSFDSKQQLRFQHQMVRFEF